MFKLLHHIIHNYDAVLQANTAWNHGQWKGCCRISVGEGNESSSRSTGLSTCTSFYSNRSSHLYSSFTFYILWSQSLFLIIYHFNPDQSEAERSRVSRRSWSSWEEDAEMKSLEYVKIHFFIAIIPCWCQ